MKKFCYILITLLYTASAYALTFEQKLTNPEQEAQATALFREIRCMVCTAESIHESKTELAQNMRHLIRNKIQEGMNNQDIKTYLVERYGYEILMSPPLIPLTYILWLAPIVMIGIGLVIVLIHLKHTNSRRNS